MTFKHRKAGHEAYDHLELKVLASRREPAMQEPVMLYMRIGEYGDFYFGVSCDLRKRDRRKQARMAALGDYVTFVVARLPRWVAELVEIGVHRAGSRFRLVEFWRLVEPIVQDCRDRRGWKTPLVEFKRAYLRRAGRENPQRPRIRAVRMREDVKRQRAEDFRARQLELSL